MTIGNSFDIAIDGGTFRDRVESIVRRYAERFLHSYRDDLENNPSRGDSLPWRGMWNHLLEELLQEMRTGRQEDQGETFAEETALELIRSGVPKTDVKATYRHVTAILPNGRYRIYRGAGNPDRRGILRILSPGESGNIRTGISALELARLLRTLDSCLPLISEIMKGLSEDMADAEREYAARLKAGEIAGTTVSTLLQAALPAMDIDCSYTIRDGRVHLNLTKELRGSIDLPLEELAGFLSDTERIHSVLSPVKVEQLQGSPSSRPASLFHRPGICNYFNGINVK